MSYGTVAPTHPIKASELDQGSSALPSRAKQDLALEVTDDLGTLIVDPMSGQRPLGCGKIGVQPSASAHPPTRRRWTVTAPGPRLSSEGLSAGLWRRRSRMAPLDSQPAATILQTESSRRSTTSDEKYHPRPRHRSAAWRERHG